MLRMQISAQDIITWTSNNKELHKKFNESTGHMEIETMKLVLKAIALERETGGKEEVNFHQMMTMARENLKTSTTVESNGRPSISLAQAKQNSGMAKSIAGMASIEWVTHPNQLKSTTPKSQKSKGKKVHGGQVG